MSTLNDDCAHARGVLRKMQSTCFEARSPDIARSNQITAGRAILEHHDRRLARRCHGLMFLIAWLTVVSYLVLSCACASTAAKSTFTRSVTQENEAAVRIYQTCGAEVRGVGSGVIVDAHHVLTAGHMLAPEGCIDIVQTTDGKPHVALTDKAWPDRDLARLMIGDTLAAAPITIAAPPAPGDAVCLVPTWPRFDRRCGDVQYYRPSRTGAVDFTAIVMPGNSGSGDYDTRGRLVGITLATMKCPVDNVSEYCTGEFASLDFLKGEKP